MFLCSVIFKKRFLMRIIILVLLFSKAPLMEIRTGFWMLMNSVCLWKREFQLKHFCSINSQLSLMMKVLKKLFLHGLSEMHKNLALLDILEIVHQSYEADVKVLFKKLFVDRRKHVGLMLNYIDV